MRGGYITMRFGKGGSAMFQTYIHFPPSRVVSASRWLGLVRYNVSKKLSYKKKRKACRLMIYREYSQIHDYS